ncbi:MAG: porin family protein [Epsilonproteobacteria bacterium]|nr:porin family protein [Campylobacterota bacterium]
MGLGVVTGLSLPVMKMSNLQKSAEFLYDLLETTQTDIKTYKFGPTIQGAYKLTPKLSSYATFGFGYQTGEMKNEWFRSSIDIDGSFQALDLGVSYIPFTKHDRLKITLGYNYKSWEMDDIEVDMFNIFKVSTFGTLKNDFSTNYFYLGAAYRF